MRWSDARSRLRFGLYALVGVIALAECAILARALVPDVDRGYRAFYIDKTTTCLDRPVAGTYALGTAVSFLPEAYDDVRVISVCGWSGPANNGLHSVGDTSQLRVRAPEGASQLTLTLEMSAASARPQSVELSVNGVHVGEMMASGRDASTQRSFIIPPAAYRNQMTLDIVLAYPDAYFPNPRANETRKRAIRLTSFQIDGTRSDS